MRIVLRVLAPRTVPKSFGMELGGDIFSVADLDDYFLPDRNPAHVRELYAELLFRHIRSNVEEDGVLDELQLREGNIRTRLFTQTPVFNELVRASEGVPRDFINIFIQAFFDAKRRGRDTVDMEAITTGSRLWYDRDKRQNLSDTQARLLERIVNEIIGERRARCFMLEQAHARHPVIRQLYDIRVLHRLRAGYSGRDQPGVRYDIYALDYGTYVDLKNTAAEPEMDFNMDDERPYDVVVPFDDHRSIRRIILSPRILDEAEPS